MADWGAGIQGLAGGLTKGYQLGLATQEEQTRRQQMEQQAAVQQQQLAMQQQAQDRQAQAEARQMKMLEDKAEMEDLKYNLDLYSNKDIPDEMKAEIGKTVLIPQINKRFKVNIDPNNIKNWGDTSLTDLAGKFSNLIKDIKSPENPNGKLKPSDAYRAGAILLSTVTKEHELKYGKGQMETIKGMAEIDKGEKPINAANWYESVGATFYPDFYTNPDSQKKWNADYTRMMATDEGKKKILGLAQEIAKNTAAPQITYLQTAEGFVPATTRGPGIGDIGEPSDYGKPLPSEQIVAEQQIGTMKDTVKAMKLNYKPEYVGPIAGRVGRLAEQTIGVSSEKAAFYAQVTQLQNSLIYLMSGKQINEQEYVRLKKQIPDVNLPVKVFEARMNEFERTIDSIVEQRTKNKGGYGPRPGKQPAQRQPSVIPRKQGETIDDYLKRTGQ